MVKTYAEVQQQFTLVVFLQLALRWWPASALRVVNQVQNQVRSVLAVTQTIKRAQS